jgi:cytochrome c oxidase assembly factor 1
LQVAELPDCHQFHRNTNNNDNYTVLAMFLHRELLRRPLLPSALSVLRRQLAAQRRTVIEVPRIDRGDLRPAPHRTQGPLLQRRPNRELPDLKHINYHKRQFWFTFPIFIGLMAVSALVLFNYQKQESSPVLSSMYALRVNYKAREVLGDNIQMADRFPWIWGSIDSLHGNVDVTFRVKGTRGMGSMRFRCIRNKLRMVCVGL